MSSSITWNETDLETLTKQKLIKEFKKENGETIFGKYLHARKYLLNNLLQEIIRKRKGLTDHGPNHIRNVMDNAYSLLGKSIDTLNAIDLYLLLLSILFHDTGNIISRKNHQKMIEDIYNKVFPDMTSAEEREEKVIVLSICQAHCGKTKADTYDTLQFIKQKTVLYRTEVHPIILATIGRLADELAEGEQRTSKYLLDKDEFNKSSLIFHQYANCSSININRCDGKICATYHIEIASNKKNCSHKSRAIIKINELSKFLQFIYSRIIKLNQERQYAKYYCSLLDSFKETSVAMNFWYNNKLLPNIELSPIVLSDIVIPGQIYQKISELYPEYNPGKLKLRISNLIKNRKKREGI